MSHLIVKFGERFMTWSTVCDAPLTPLMTLPELKRHLFEEEGYRALEDLPARLKRVEKFGTSSTMGTTKDDLLSNNQCGPDGAGVETEEEMIRLFSPGAPQPGFYEEPILDLEKALVIKNQYGIGTFKATLSDVRPLYDDLVFALATVPELEKPVAVMFKRNGFILSKSFAGLSVMYNET